MEKCIVVRVPQHVDVAQGMQMVLNLLQDLQRQILAFCKG